MINKKMVNVKIDNLDELQLFQSQKVKKEEKKEDELEKKPSKANAKQV
jgi:hypothetical protein